MKRNIRMVLLLVLLSPMLHTGAQEGRLKLGVGANYITNNFDEAYLTGFAAYSFNTSYALLQQPKFSVVWEQSLLLRQRQNQHFQKRAAILSMPLNFRYQASTKTGVYAGLGPAYLSQRYEDHATRQRVRGMYATALAGVALRSRTFAEVLFIEYHLRAGVHRSLSGSGNMAPFLSLLVQLGTNQRAGKVREKGTRAG